MYKDDVKIHLRDNRDEKKSLLFDFLGIYIKMRIFLPNLVDERNALVKLASEYYKAIVNEDEILLAIEKSFGKVDDNEEIDELFEELDDMYKERYNYYQKAFLDYEEVLCEYTDIIEMIRLRVEASKLGRAYNPGYEVRHRFIPRKIDFPVFDSEYKERTIEKIKTIKPSDRYELE